MKFKNTNEPARVRFENENGKYWKTVESGEEIDLPEDKGLAYGFEPLEEESESEEIENTEESEEESESEEPNKQESMNFQDELNSIKYVGKKTVNDLLEIYENREQLIDDLKNNKHIPVRNDVAERIKEHFKYEL